MLRSVNDLRGFSIGATDGDIGQVESYCFDERDWTIRYVVVNAGGWLSPRKLLVSSLIVDGANWNGRTFETALTRDEVKNSPAIATTGSSTGPFKSGGNKNAGGPKFTNASTRDNDCARTTEEIEGLRLHARDGEIGHVEDSIIDDKTWTIRYLVVDTRNWWRGKKVMLSPRWIKEIGWNKRTVYVDLSCGQIKESPEYDDSMSIDREYEERLYSYYGEPGYWNE